MFKVQKVTGPLLKQRLVIKQFKTSQARDEFLNSQYNLDWSEVKNESLQGLTPGTYAFVGQKWVNVKKLDPSILAHI